MKIIRLLLGRRRFLVAIISSIILLTFKRIAKAFDLFFQTSVAKASYKPVPAEKKSLKGIVVYYSATGSTGKLAGAIYRGMKTIIDCDVAPIKKIDPKEIGKYHVVAIGGPIWYYRETANLRLFVYNMPRMVGKLCILFCSHGTQPSGFFYSLMQPLRKKGFTIIGWNDWYGGASHVLHMPTPYVTDGHPDEIDLQEAEAFGREMAERAQRIYAGERKLIPDIPSGPNADPLWIKSGMVGGGSGIPEATIVTGVAVEGAASDSPGGMPGTGDASGGPAGGPAGMMASDEIPHINTAKCVYPRCTACMDNCIVNAIDLSIKAPSRRISGSSIFIKGCEHCGQPLCQRSCSYDAITYEQSRTKHVFDMTKCTYPKCTLCVDNCPMNSIDFSQSQPFIHENCEGCDLCWCICPENAISIPNIADTHARLANSETSWDSPFLANLNQAEKIGRFRRLVPIDQVGWGNLVYKLPNAPRVVLHEENYPYHINENNRSPGK